VCKISKRQLSLPSASRRIRMTTMMMLLLMRTTKIASCAPTWGGIKEDALTASQTTFSTVQESLSSPIDRRSDYYRQRAREQQLQPQSQQSSKPQPLLTAPNVLTFMRLLLVPVLVVLWFLPHKSAPLASALTFIFAAITDWADGYLARRVSSPHCVQH